MNDQVTAAVMAKIHSTDFFPRLGVRDTDGGHVLRMSSVREVFVDGCPTLSGREVKSIKWLPFANDEKDPFYGKDSFPKELSAQRMQINKAVSIALRGKVTSERFATGAHDFTRPASTSASYAFRAYLGESYLGLGDRWNRVVAEFERGHWPVGFLNDKLISI
ncbi:hypothetical protein [Lysobacter enzymogenes]|uniref:hypothetical protein n=1 Tax=Lysobacter enzymogenes TaxID=69 RepID=UPI000F4B8249|nr:hypothetical protein [Lysobacter enzymogenes]